MNALSEYIPDEAEVSFTPESKRFAEPPQQPQDEQTRKAQAQKARQKKLAFDREVLKNSIAAKLQSIGEHDLADTLDVCRTQQFILECTGCRKTKVVYNRCEVFYCPCCQPRLAYEKKKSVEWWAEQFTQPKHVVLTTRNTEAFGPERVKGIKSAFTKLRRRKFAANWKGGFYSLEVTNEGKGWHLHLHCLIDAHWIDARQLAAQWADVVGQDCAIVKVKDARGQDYLRELCKYVCDGNQIAKWTPEQIRDYVKAFQGQRTFAVFGHLYKARAEHRKFLDGLQTEKPKCDCGCTDVRIFSEQEWEWEMCKRGPPRAAGHAASLAGETTRQSELSLVMPVLWPD